MNLALLAALVLDNSLVIAILALCTGLVPGLLAWLNERSKVKILERQIQQLEGLAKRLEELITNQENVRISLEGQIEELTGALRTLAVARANQGADSELMTTEVSSLIEPEAPAEMSGDFPPGQDGKYVVWVPGTLVDSPRYALLTWSKTGDRIGFKLRDYIGGKLFQSPGSPPGREAGFDLFECPLAIENLWSTARGHMLARGEFLKAVSDHSWWKARLAEMTAGHDSAEANGLISAISEGIRNVLLMLASTQNPPPREEIRWHAANPSEDGLSYVATTRMLTGLKAGRSVVLFYGDVSLANQLLGYGLYEGYLNATADEARPFLERSDLYGKKGMPSRVLGLIKLSRFTALPAGVSLDDLRCRIISDGVGNNRPLSLLNLPVGPARSQVYFQRAERS